jgi:hypothetical protein
MGRLASAPEEVQTAAVAGLLEGGHEEGKETDMEPWVWVVIAIAAVLFLLLLFRWRAGGGDRRVIVRRSGAPRRRRRWV